MLEVSAVWDNPEHTVIVQTLSGDWNWDQFQEMVTATDEMMSSVPHTIDFIVDMRESGPLPRGIIHRVHRTFVRGPDNWGVIVFIQPTPLIRSLLTVFTQIYPRIGQYGQLADSMEEARAICQRVQQARADEANST